MCKTYSIINYSEVKQIFIQESEILILAHICLYMAKVLFLDLSVLHIWKSCSKNKQTENKHNSLVKMLLLQKEDHWLFGWLEPT